jgi:hypothetical protein
MLTRPMPIHVIPLLLGLIAGTAIPDVSCADQPTPVLRTFGFFVTDETGEAPDFLGEGSHAVVVTGAMDGFVITLLNEDHTELTTWLGADAQHSGQGGEPAGRYCWLVDDENPYTPPVGARTFMGPDGSIESVDVVRIKRCGLTGCEYGNEFHWEIDDDGTHTFVIVSAWFSK